MFQELDFHDITIELRGVHKTLENVGDSDSISFHAEFWDGFFNNDITVRDNSLECVVAQRSFRLFPLCLELITDFRFIAI